VIAAGDERACVTREVGKPIDGEEGEEPCATVTSAATIVSVTLAVDVGSS
jgi:hypothetical protein